MVKEIPNNEESEGEPPIEVIELVKILYSLVGIVDVRDWIENVYQIEAKDLRHLPYADLPIGALLRTNGGRPNEVIVQFEFRIDKSPESLISLEFISWFVRDQSRGGEKLQLRAAALPPVASSGVQLGTTLRFYIDCFFDEPTETLQSILLKIAKMTESLKLFIEVYSIPTKN